jgi:hypothetical protein
LSAIGAGDAPVATLKALKETAEADAYATSLHEAAEIAVDAARLPGLDTFATCCCRRGAQSGGSFFE